MGFQASAAAALARSLQRETDAKRARVPRDAAGPGRAGGLAGRAGRGHGGAGRGHRLARHVGAQLRYLPLGAVRALEAIRPEDAGPEDRVFGLSGRQVGRRVRAAARAADIGSGFSGDSGRVELAAGLSRALPLPHKSRLNFCSCVVSFLGHARAEPDLLHALQPRRGLAAFS